MATPEFSKPVSTAASFPPRRLEVPEVRHACPATGKVRFWIVLDLVTILVAAVLATLWKAHTGPLAGARGFWHGTLFHGRPMGNLLALTAGFAVALILTSRRFHLYTPKRLTGILHEQRLSVQ